MKIAVFDSGVGGLTVLKEMIQHFPGHQYVYYADSENVPYGWLTEEKVKSLILEAAEFLSSQNIDILVLACHTATRLMARELESIYDFPIVGMESGLKELSIENRSKILVCGTDLSVHIWKNELENSPLELSYESLQQLSLYAEAGDLNNPQIIEYLRAKLTPYPWDEYDGIFLGCTHYPFFKDQIRTIIPSHIKILDGIQPTIQIIKTFMSTELSREINNIRYYVSGIPKESVFFAKYFGTKVRRS